MSTTFLKKEKVVRRWFLIDAAGKTVGRLSANIAAVLRGKNKAIFTPFTDSGDFIVVINADKVFFSGRKAKNKIYKRHSGYPGGLTKTAARNMNPAEIVRLAVRGMLPDNKLRDKQMARLKIFAGSNHTYAAQKPEILNI